MNSIIGPVCEDKALSLWNATPLLRVAFVDFQHFNEAFAIAHANPRRDGAFLGDLRAWAEDEISTARARLALARRPLTSRGRPAASFVEHIGASRLALWLYGAITPFEGVAAAQICANELERVLDSLADISAITMRIDSVGGNPHVARAIALRLRRCRARKIAIIDGSCSSAANWFAAAADRVLMRANATWFSHHCRTLAYGEENDLRNAAWEARNSDIALARDMSLKRRISFDAFRQLQHESRFIGAEEALSRGLIDQIIPALPATSEMPDTRELDNQSEKYP